MACTARLSGLHSTLEWFAQHAKRLSTSGKTFLDKHGVASVLDARTYGSGNPCKNFCCRRHLLRYCNLQGNVGHRRTRGTVVFFYLFKKLKTLNFKVSMVI